MADPLQFLFAVLLLLAIPGPTNTVMAIAGATHRDEGLVKFLAATLLGYLSIIALARLLLLPLTAAYPPLGVALKLAVAVYLIYAAVRLWRAPLAISETSSPVGPALVFTTTLLNPKGLVFALSIIPQAHPLLWAYFAGFTGLVGIVGAGWFMAGRGLAHLSGARAGALPRVGALALVGFAAWLASSVAG
jgi:threonine/homoserine/homoserine lactone efflux protein